MKLDVEERLALIGLLNNLTGSAEAVHTLRRVRGMVGFTPQEMKRLKFQRLPDESLKCDEKEAAKIYLEAPLDDWTIEYIHDLLVQLDKDGQMREALLGLYGKFVFVDIPLPKMDEVRAARIRKQRNGKKTVAIVGMSPRSCSLAPFGEKDLELWSMNEVHAYSWMTRATRWFQIHVNYTKKHSKRGVVGHLDWLKENPWNIPIYMIEAHKDIKHSVAYPMEEVCNRFLDGLIKEEEKLIYFNSAVDYMIALACLQEFKRIELYGIDIDDVAEADVQKPSALFWLGIARGLGIQIWTPKESVLMKSNRYGHEFTY